MGSIWLGFSRFKIIVRLFDLHLIMNPSSRIPWRTMAKSILQYVHQVGSTSMRRPIIWISLSLANFICIGFLLWLSLSSTHLGATVELTNTTFYSTHPKVAYAPESCCVKGPFGRCKKRYDPFTLSTYVDPDSTKRTFFQTSSWGNEPESSNMKRRVEITFYGEPLGNIRE